MAIDRATNTKRLTLVVWAFVSFFYFYLSYDYVRMTTHDRQFADYMHHVVQISGTDGRSAKDIRDLLLIKADQLSLPVRGEQIVVRGRGESLHVAVNYNVDIDIPVLQREVYRKTFEHSVKYQGPQW
jgi:hypothetical protein